MNQPNNVTEPERKKLHLPSGRDDITLPDWALAPAAPRNLTGGPQRVREAARTPGK